MPMQIPIPTTLLPRCLRLLQSLLERNGYVVRRKEEEENRLRVEAVQRAILDDRVKDLNSLLSQERLARTNLEKSLGGQEAIRDAEKRGFESQINQLKSMVDWYARRLGNQGVFDTSVPEAQKIDPTMIPKRVLPREQARRLTRQFFEEAQLKGQSSPFGGPIYENGQGIGNIE